MERARGNNATRAIHLCGGGLFSFYKNKNPLFSGSLLYVLELARNLADSS